MNLGVFLFYIAAIILIGGLVFKILQYGCTLALLKIPTTSVRVTRGKVAIHLLKDVTVFTRLLKSKQVDRTVPCRLCGYGCTTCVISPSLQGLRF